MGKWPRNRSTAPGGGLSTAPGGGMSTAGPPHYHSNIPPIDVFVKELRKRGYHSQAERLEKAHGL